MVHIRHYFNNIEYTKWPFFISIWVFFFLFFFSLFINKYQIISVTYLVVCLLFFIFTIFNWFFDLIIESSHLGRYNRKIRSSLVMGFFLFLASEIMLFGGFFWTFFDRIFHLTAYTFNMSQLNGFELLSWYKIPFLATLILLISGYLLNTSYYYLRFRDSISSTNYLILTYLLAVTFLMVQYFEYQELTFTISDSVYCSLFFLLTGFHGMHVIVGTIFLVVMLERQEINSLNYSDIRYLGFGLAVIYWHFVDIIWIFLFLFVYVFNNWNIIEFIWSTNYIISMA